MSATHAAPPNPHIPEQPIQISITITSRPRLNVLPEGESSCLSSCLVACAALTLELQTSNSPACATYNVQCEVPATRCDRLTPTSDLFRSFSFIPFPPAPRRPPVSDHARHMLRRPPISRFSVLDCGFAFSSLILICFRFWIPRMCTRAPSPANLTLSTPSSPSSPGSFLRFVAYSCACRTFQPLGFWLLASEERECG